jgi:endogenous inhibitor of DNA gyrase (YacG/DUF329 family)
MELEDKRCGLPADVVILRTHLEGLTGLDLLRCQALVSPPRALVLVVGCVGILLGLCEAVPDWEGCQKLLQGEAALRPRGFGRAVVERKRPLLERMREYDETAVRPPMRAAVINTVRGDVGGLMHSSHLQQINRTAEALGRWLAAAVGRLQRAGPAADEAPSTPSTLFVAPASRRCPTCGRQVAEEAFAAHEPLCLARERAKEGNQWQQAAARALQLAHASTQPELERRSHSIKPLLAPSEAPTLPPQRPPRHPTPPVSVAPSARGTGVASSSPASRSPPSIPSPASPPSVPRWTDEPPLPAATPRLNPRPNPDSLPEERARSRSSSRPLWHDSDGGFEYLRARSGFAGAVPPRPETPGRSVPSRARDPAPGGRMTGMRPGARPGEGFSAALVAPRRTVAGGARRPPPERTGDSPPAEETTHVLSRADHLKVIRARLEKDWGAAASSRQR